MKKAFTLAEVLITLGIIGVVAAMTLPQLTTNYQKHETVAKLKKNYTIVQQALKLSEIDNGSILYWDTKLNGHAFFEKYLKNYFINPKEITNSQLNTKFERKWLNGLRYNGTTYAGDNTSHFLLNDGSMISINLHDIAEEGLWVGIDINGFKSPNTLGKDTFVFFFNPKHGLSPFGTTGTPETHLCTNCTRAKLLSGNQNSCNKNNLGRWCTYLIINDGWEIKDDYPW